MGTLQDVRCGKMRDSDEPADGRGASNKSEQDKAVHRSVRGQWGEHTWHDARCDDEVCCDVSEAVRDGAIPALQTMHLFVRVLCAIKVR